MPNRTSAAVEITHPAAVRAARRRRGVTAAVVAVVLVGCHGRPAATGASAAPDMVPRVKAVISRLNAATVTVSEQRAALLALVDPGQRATQQRCGPAHSTLTLEPVYAYLALATNFRPASGTMTGPVYSLPALVRVHREGRITGSDVVDLHLTITDTLVALAAVCPS